MLASQESPTCTAACFCGNRWACRWCAPAPLLTNDELHSVSYAFYGFCLVILAKAPRRLTTNSPNQLFGLSQPLLTDSIKARGIVHQYFPLAFLADILSLEKNIHRAVETITVRDVRT